MQTQLGVPSELNHWTCMLRQQTMITSCAASIQSELRQGHCPLVGWLTPWMLIMSHDLHARQTNVRPSQRAVCPLQDSLAYVLTRPDSKGGEMIHGMSSF